MTRGKRAYIPKVRGCYECSQRRIHCDRGQPTCAKCLAKGVQCSGLGVRYRFTGDGVRRGRLGIQYRSSVAPVVESNGFTPSSPDAQSPEDAELCYNITGCQASFGGWPRPSATYAMMSVPSGVLQEGALSSIAHPSRAYTVRDLALIARTPADTLEPWERSFLMHFSDRIAPEMVVIDDQQNGWRHLVLPIAYADELVRDAVLSTAAFHFSAQVNRELSTPDVLYQKAIWGLRQRQNLADENAYGKQTILLTLVVLLVAEMVNGLSDFHALFGLLEAALRAVGGEVAIMDGDAGVFLVRQIRKFRGYAAPLLSQAQGVAVLSQTASIRPSASNGWECFRSYFRAYPNLSDSMSLIYDLQEQACQLYVERVQAGSNGPPLTELVEGFKKNMEMLPVGSTGAHILVWATVIAASESATPEHQQYFADVLMKHHDRNGFANIVSALQYLRSFWTGSTDRDWTKLLPNLQVFIASG